MKKKVLIVITKADWAGAQRVVYEIAKYTKENHSEIELHVAVGSEGLLVDKLEEIKIKVIKLKNLIHPINLIQDYKGYKELVKIIKENKYDVVHAHSTKAGMLSRVAAKKCNVKNIIFTVHGWWPILQFRGFKRKLAAGIERYIATKTTKLVFICEKDVEIARNYKIGKKEQFIKIYNSITIDVVEENVIRKEFNIPEESYIIGNVARVDKQKNPQLFIEIAEEHLKNSKNNIYYFWVGDGELKDNIEQQIHERGLENNVKFIGFRENGLDYINDFDVLFMTSESEGMPITVLEALELKKPIISTNVGGVIELIGKENVFEKNTSIENIINMLENAEYRYSPNAQTMQEEYVKLYLS